MEDSLQGTLDLLILKTLQQVRIKVDKAPDNEPGLR
jgi:hypothetical protein